MKRLGKPGGVPIFSGKLADAPVKLMLDIAGEGRKSRLLRYFHSHASKAL